MVEKIIIFAAFAVFCLNCCLCPHTAQADEVSFTLLNDTGHREWCKPKISRRGRNVVGCDGEEVSAVRLWAQWGDPFSSSRFVVRPNFDSADIPSSEIIKVTPGGINSRGEVTGQVSYVHPSSLDKDLRRTHSNRWFVFHVWTPAMPQMDAPASGPLLQSYETMNAINDLGRTAGSHVADSQFSSLPIVFLGRYFRNPITPGYPETHIAASHDILAMNNNTALAGSISVASSTYAFKTQTHAALFSISDDLGPSGFRDLHERAHLPEGDLSEAVAINESGAVLIHVRAPTGTFHSVFSYPNGRPVPFPETSESNCRVCRHGRDYSLPNFSCSQCSSVVARDTQRNNIVVGDMIPFAASDFTNPISHAFVQTWGIAGPSRYLDLNSLLPQNFRYELLEATGVDNGDSDQGLADSISIVGLAQDRHNPRPRMLPFLMRVPRARLPVAPSLTFQNLPQILRWQPSL